MEVPMHLDAEVARPPEGEMSQVAGWPRLTLAADGVITGSWAGGGGLHAYLEAGGWRHTVAPDADAAAGEDDDERAVAEATPCAACGAVVGRYQAFHRSAGERLSVTICGSCGHASTF
jgi:hypothetical protein